MAQISRAMRRALRLSGQRLPRRLSARHRRRAARGRGNGTRQKPRGDLRGPSARRAAGRGQGSVHRRRHRPRAPAARRRGVPPRARSRLDRHLGRHPRGSCGVRRDFRFLVQRALADRRWLHRPGGRESEGRRPRLPQGRSALVQEHGLWRRKGSGDGARERHQDLFRLRHRLRASTSASGASSTCSTSGAPIITATSRGCARA